MDPFMENTKQAGHVRELKRLHDNHDVMTDAMGGLLMAPVDFSKPGLRVLDSATADGTWLRDLVEAVSKSNTYIGTDIEQELFTSQLPAGMTLAQQDINKPWPSEWQSSFDFVHQRLALAGATGTSIAQVTNNLVGLVKPGGWIELVELDVGGHKEAGPILSDFLKLLREIFAIVGNEGNFSLKLRGFLATAGLEDVQEHFVDLPTGARNPDPDLAAKSINGCCGALEPLIAVAKTLPTSFTPEQLSSLETRLRDELANEGGVTRLVIAFGRKPALAGS